MRTRSVYSVDRYVALFVEQRGVHEIGGGGTHCVHQRRANRTTRNPHYETGLDCIVPHIGGDVVQQVDALIGIYT